ncbi:MltR family transcriptional regulator [Dyella choica]|nr:MltR family transcriptional regulator [Dyella choica]
MSNMEEALKAFKAKAFSLIADEEVRAMAEEVFNFRSLLNSETDRGAALMAGSFLDQKLTTLLKRRLVEDKKVSESAFDHAGPLGSFASRIDFSYLIGCLSKSAWRDLQLIRKVRNDFGHVAGPISFEDPAISQRCKALSFAGKSVEMDARAKFKRAVMGLLAHIGTATVTTVRLEKALDPQIPKDMSRSEAMDLLRKFAEGEMAPS